MQENYTSLNMNLKNHMKCTLCLRKQMRSLKMIKQFINNLINVGNDSMFYKSSCIKVEFDSKTKLILT